ncbi:hypothetical protein V0R50_21625 [Pseudomonas sp. 148P]|uniref:Apea-like HEPN domain-containing protein n=1 Tax=Pseudomonas ulcerans TaxID=3115852 RepID=A0ABU7HWN8_9PSED|nr:MULTISPECIES: hypothetical protein [unclassified Pseudomonas]MEE1924650.1 hypothetical protein [Pseudomonas sp. 147P]MEE1935836.1 hypothetical protein [Pseudomonas sp. 148P]
MNKEDAKKWLDYYERGIKPSRYKLKAVVYSDNILEVTAGFEFNGFEVELTPLSADQKELRYEGGFPSAFNCEVVSTQQSHRNGNNFDLSECLDRIMPVLGFRYRLPLDYLQWEEYEGEWITSIAGGGSMVMQRIHSELPHQNIHEVIEAYEVAAVRTDKRSKKCAALRRRLKESLELEDISRRFSFLSYYNILEIISDDLASARSIPSSNTIAEDLAKFGLSTKGSQRTKIYFLLLAMNNEFDLQKSIQLADVRNDLAHGELTVGSEEFNLCKKIAYWAADSYALELSRLFKMA